MFLSSRSLFLLLPTVIGSCSSVQTSPIGPKTWLLRCESSLAGCAARGKNLCRDAGFHVVRGHSYSMLSGVEGNQIEFSEHEMVIRCGPPPEHVERVDESVTPIAESERSDEARVKELLGTRCVPGETQECVGTGACRGGQTCLESGAGYGPCDCGRTPTPAKDQDPNEGEDPAAAEPSDPASAKTSKQEPTSAADQDGEAPPEAATAQP